MSGGNTTRQPTDPFDQDSIFDATPAEIDARVDELGKRPGLAAAEKLELNQLRHWQAKVLLADIKSTKNNTKSEKHVIDSYTKIISPNLAWAEYGTDYAARNTLRIEQIKIILAGGILTNVKGKDKDEVINNYIYKLTKGEYTPSSMQQLYTNIIALEADDITDAAAAFKALDPLIAKLEPLKAPTPAPAPTPTPAPNVVMDQWNVHDYTDAEIEARMKAREAVGITDAEYLQLRRWVAIKKAQAISLNNPDFSNTGTGFKSIADANATIIAPEVPWPLLTKAEAKSNLITKMQADLGLALSGLNPADKATLIKDYEDKLKAGNHTIASLKALSDKISNDASLKSFTDINAAKKHLDDLMQQTLQQQNNPAAAASGAAHGGSVATNDPQALEKAGYNPFVLESKTVMGQMFEAFLKSFTTMPWQIIFDVGLRLLSEPLSKVFGMGMTAFGVTAKLGAYGLNIISLGYLNMRTLHGWGDMALATGKKYDGTLPLLYQPILGMFQKLISHPDASKNLSGYNALENFKNSIIPMPLRLPIPGGAFVWNTATASGTGLLALGNFAMSGVNNSLGIILAKLPVTKKYAQERFKAADYYNANTRLYGAEALGTVVQMLTPPFFRIIGPAPLSEGGKAVRDASYSVLEEVNPTWFGKGNLARWLSDTHNRGTVSNNPSIQTKAYLEEQQPRLDEISKILSGAATTIPQDNIDDILNKIKAGNYSIKKIDDYMEAIKNNTSLDQTEAYSSFDSILKGHERANIQTRTMLDFISTPIMWPIVGLSLIALSPLLLLTIPLYALWKIPDVFRSMPKFYSLIKSSIKEGIRGLRSTTPAPPAPPFAPVSTLADTFRGLDRGTIENKHQEWDDRLKHSGGEMPTILRKALSIPEKYQIGDGAKHLQELDSETPKPVLPPNKTRVFLAPPPVVPSPVVPPAPKPSALSSTSPPPALGPHPATPSRSASLSSLGSQPSVSEMSTRTVGRVGAAFTRMYAAVSGIGTGFFASKRAEFVLEQAENPATPPSNPSHSGG